MGLSAIRSEFMEMILPREMCDASQKYRHLDIFLVRVVWRSNGDTA
jgi:hypothetical protein